MDLIPIFIGIGPLGLDLFCQGSIVDRTRKGAIAKHAFAPLIYPFRIDHKKGQASIRLNRDTILPLQHLEQVFLLLSPLLLLILSPISPLDACLNIFSTIFLMTTFILIG